MTIQLVMEVAARAPISRSISRIVGLPRREQATLGVGRSAKYSQKPGQGVASGTGALAGGQDSCRRRCVSGVEMDHSGVEQSTFPVLRRW